MGNSDEFATDPQSSSSYSKDTYYIASTDSKGHGTKSYFSVPPQVKGEIAALLAARAFPAYRTEADFWRDAGVHRLHELSESMKDTSPVASSRINIIARQLATESDLEYERRSIEYDERTYNNATFLMSHPPSFTTVSAIRRAIAEVGDVEIKSKLSRELDAYEARYLKD